MRYLFLLIILYLCFNFVTLGQEVNIEFEKKPYWVENFDKKGGLDDKLWGSKKEKSGGLVFYTGADEKNVKVKKGKLILTIRKDSASGKYLYPVRGPGIHQRHRVHPAQRAHVGTEAGPERL